MIIFHNDFIFERRNAVSKKYCNDLIEFYENTPERHIDGIVGNKEVDPNVKKSRDIAFDEFDSSDQRVRRVLDPIMKELEDCFLNFYVPRFQISFDALARFAVCPYFNLQKYEPQEGYYLWHSESSINNNQARKLVWMVYLNDVESGGTEFLNQNLTTQAKAGTILIWPADWTHTHRGQRGALTCKYILTGWYTFL